MIDERRYYKLPLSFDNLFNNNNLPLCSLGESIAQHLQLLIETHYGEHQGDMNFGCEIWEFDFELMMKRENYEQKLKQSLSEAIKQYERRLTAVEVEVIITDEEIYNSVSGSKEMKKQATIVINANVKETTESFYFKTVFHLNPIISV